MSCAPFDLRDYWLEELPADERRQVDEHLAACGSCREELERLRATHQALLRLKDEEIPRRIAFVSDKVFEPSRVARWWAGLGIYVPKLAVSFALVLAVFFAGAWISKPSITVAEGRWQLAFGAGAANVQQEVAKMQVQHTADMQDVRQSYELLLKEMNVLYMQSAQTAGARPAAFRQ
jgi:anti-sigma factor RsiW